MILTYMRFQKRMLLEPINEANEVEKYEPIEKTD